MDAGRFSNIVVIGKEVLEPADSSNPTHAAGFLNALQI